MCTMKYCWICEKETEICTNNPCSKRSNHCSICGARYRTREEEIKHQVVTPGDIENDLDCFVDAGLMLRELIHGENYYRFSPEGTEINRKIMHDVPLTDEETIMLRKAGLEAKVISKELQNA